MTPFVQICRGTQTWQENAQCLVSGVQRSPTEFVSEDLAISAVSEACALTPSWNEERECFAASLRNGRLSSLSYYAQSCLQMGSAESSARCFRQIFGSR